MSKIKKILLVGSVSAFLLLGIATPFLAAHAQASYLITASDTIPVFQLGAQAVKDNGLAILNVAVPYLAGAAVAFAVILIIWVVVRYFKNHRA